jgi:hypothetical protein
MDRIRNETIRTKMGTKKDLLQETAMSCEWTIAELLHRLQNGTHKRKGGVGNQSVHGRMGLGTACKGETLRMKNVSIVSSGARKLYCRAYSVATIIRRVLD